MSNNSLSRLHLEREFYSKIIEKYDRLSPKLVRDTVHLYSRIGRRRYISYAFEIDTIMRRLELKDILDWGAIYGHMSFLLNSLGQNVAAMDVAGGLAKVDYDDITPIFEFPIRMVVDHENIPYPDNSFDAVLFFESPCHFPIEISFFEKFGESFDLEVGWPVKTGWRRMD